MGNLDVHCSYSGLALTGSVQVLLLEKAEDEKWRVLAAPLRGTYDRFGRIDWPRSEDKVTAQFRSFAEWAMTLGAKDFHGAFEEMKWGGAPWAGAIVSYALVDSGIYDALPGATNEADGRLPVGLQIPFKESVKGVLPTDVDDAEQYYGLAGDYGCNERVVAALAKFGGDPAMVAAITRNREQWQELDE